MSRPSALNLADMYRIQTLLGLICIHVESLEKAGVCTELVVFPAPKKHKCRVTFLRRPEDRQEIPLPKLDEAARAQVAVGIGEALLKATNHDAASHPRQSLRKGHRL